MFSGITGLDCGDNISVGCSDSGSNTSSNNHATSLTSTSLAAAMISKEGENVPFASTIDLTVPVKDWLCVLESQMIITLSTLLQQAIDTSLKIVNGVISRDTASVSTIVGVDSNGDTNNGLLEWMKLFPAQIIILSSQLTWTSNIEESLLNKSMTSNISSGDSNHSTTVATKTNTLNMLENRLLLLTQYILYNLPLSLRKKCEQLLTEMVYQRDVVRTLIDGNVISNNDFTWLYHLRFYWSNTNIGSSSGNRISNSNSSTQQQQLSIKISNAIFNYGFEYLGIGERLVQTPLTDRCYLTLTQALHYRLGGNPFGPAGTGKTESVKMLGSQLGRFVIVFNCDSSFDYTAMGRIFAGLCQVGAWGCFDEFNRLEERILSAVSQQILTIQRGLQLHQPTIELLGNQCQLSTNVGIFVTMNPGYAGRSNLPDNLKQLFRAVAMTIPDRKLIAQVMLFRLVMIFEISFVFPITCFCYHDHHHINFSSFCRDNQ